MHASPFFQFTHRFPLMLATTLAVIVLVGHPRCTVAAPVAVPAYAPIYDPSARSVGMASSTVAVFWGGDPNSWANPALLGYTHGLCFEHATAPLYDMSNGPESRLDRIGLGAWGVGVAVAGEPFDALGRQERAMGPAHELLAGGELGPAFTMVDEQHSWAAGANVMELGEHVLRAFGLEVADIHRFADVSVGLSESRWRTTVESDSAIAIAGKLAGKPAYSRDSGHLLRVTPFDSIDGKGWWPMLDRAMSPFGGLRLDAAWGEAKLNEKLWPSKVEGWAVRGSLGVPRALQDALSGGAVGRLLARSISPGLAVARAWARPQSASPDTEWRGWEISVANVFTWRDGRVDHLWGVDQNTSGWSLGLLLAGYGGFRYDHATATFGDGLEGFGSHEYDHTGFTAFLEPVAIWQSVRGR